MSDVSNLTLQPTAVTEAELAPLPPIPDALLKIAGVSAWWEEMKLTRERDKETLYRLMLTRSGTSRRGGGSGISNRITAIGKSVINAQSSSTTNVTNAGDVTNIVNGTMTPFDKDSLLLAWIGL